MEVLEDTDQTDEVQEVAFHSLQVNRVEIMAGGTSVGRVVSKRRRRRRQQQQQQHHGVYPVSGSSRGSSSSQAQRQVQLGDSPQQRRRQQPRVYPRPPATPAAEQGRRWRSKRHVSGSGSSTWRAALPDTLVDHEKSQQAMCGVTMQQMEVMVYKILTRLASNGRMAADCGNGLQHISDVNSGIPDVAVPGTVEQFGDVPGGERQIGDSHTARADDVADDISDSHTGEVDVLVQENGILVQEDALQDEALLVQENGMYDDIVPNMKRNDVLVVPRQQRGHKRGRRRQQKVPLWQQPDPDFEMCFPFF